jgi:hypothetical protein
MVLVSIDLSVLQMVAVHRPGLVSDTLTTFVVYKSLYLLLAKPVFLIMKHRSCWSMFIPRKLCSVGPKDHKIVASRAIESMEVP